MKNLLKLTNLLILLALFGCTSSEEESCTDNCANSDTKPTVRSVQLGISFKDSQFYDFESKNFRTLTSTDIVAGNLGGRVPVYADFLEYTQEEAMTYISQIDAQVADRDSYQEDELSRIPFIAINAQSGVTYIYKYTKLDTAGKEVASANGIFLLEGDTAYLPLVNESFNGRFFANSSGGSQSDYTHRIQIAAQSANSSQSDNYTISFSSSLIVPNKDFDVSYSDDMQAISLKNRWNYFYDEADGAPNTELLLGKLVEKADLSSESALDLKDLRIVFKTKPKIEMVYTIFDENPIYKTSDDVGANVTVLRGYEFYEKIYSLTSDRDFGLVFKVNDSDTALTNSDKEAIVRDVSAGINWSMTFGYNLTQAATYPSGKVLLKPLRPICNSVTNTPYTPITTSKWRDTINALSGFASVCHPDSWKAESSNAADLGSFPLEQTDTFFDYFSYMTNKDISDNVQSKRVRVGHFYGIKSIEFKIEGCLKLYSRDASVLETNPNAWVQKNNESGNCSSGEGDTGWTEFKLSKSLSIFDNANDYSAVPGLKELINNYGNSVPVTSTEFLFNNDKFYEHVH